MLRLLFCIFWQKRKNARVSFFCAALPFSANDGRSPGARSLRARLGVEISPLIACGNLSPLRSGGLFSLGERRRPWSPLRLRSTCGRVRRGGHCLARFLRPQTLLEDYGFATPVTSVTGSHDASIWAFPRLARIWARAACSTKGPTVRRSLREIQITDTSYAAADSSVSTSGNGHEREERDKKTQPRGQRPVAPAAITEDRGFRGSGHGPREDERGGV